MQPDAIDRTCAVLQEYQVQRRGLIRAKNRIVLQAKAIVRRALNWQPDMEEKAQKGVNARAARIVDAFFAEKPQPAADAEIVGQLAGQLAVYRAMAAPAVAQIKSVEKEMIRLAKTLPGYEFVESVAGLGDKAFAIVVGEAGNLSNYPKKGHLWKRLGLAPFGKDGSVKACSTWAREGGLSAEDWTAAGYKRDRLAEVFSCVADPMAKGKQLESAEKSGTEYGRPLGPYGEIYVRRRELTAQRYPEWSRARARADALRIMAKRVIRDLWQAWRRATVTMPDRAIRALPAADEHRDEREAISSVPARASRRVPPAHTPAA